MALIKCKECGKEISSIAEKCPHCGYKTEYGDKQSQTKATGIELLIYCILLLVGLVLVLWNIGTLIELFGRWSDIKDWYRISFFGYLSDKEQMGVFWKVFIGLILMVTCVFNINNIYNRLKADAHEAEIEKNKEASKRLPKLKMEVRSDDWKCVCGNVNRNYITTCSCGRSKRDVVNRTE